jgi:hypothetical protein
MTTPAERVEEPREVSIHEVETQEEQDRILAPNAHHHATVANVYAWR